VKPDPPDKTVKGGGQYAFKLATTNTPPKTPFALYPPDAALRQGLAIADSSASFVLSNATAHFLEEDCQITARRAALRDT